MAECSLMKHLNMCQARLGRSWDHLSKTGIREIMKASGNKRSSRSYRPSNGKKFYTVRIPAEAFRNSSQNDTSREPYIVNGRIHFKG